MFSKANLTKKSMTLVMAVAILFGSSVSALAAEPSPAPGAVDNATTVESTTTEISAFSDEIGGLGGAVISDETYIDANDFKKKIRENSVQPYATGWYNLPGTTYRYEQLDPYYCVPATMQTVLRYNNGTTPPAQSTIAKDMGFTSGVGVDFLKVPDYLNGKQSKATYAIHKKSSKESMTARIEADITDYVVPTPIRIKVSNSSDWFYTTAGHAIVCNSIMSDSSKVQLIDPGVGRGTYQKSASDLYKVFTHLAW